MQPGEPLDLTRLPVCLDCVAEYGEPERPYRHALPVERCEASRCVQRQRSAFFFPDPNV